MLLSQPITVNGVEQVAAMETTRAVNPPNRRATVLASDKPSDSYICHSNGPFGSEFHFKRYVTQQLPPAEFLLSHKQLIRPGGGDNIRKQQNLLEFILKWDESPNRNLWRSNYWSDISVWIKKKCWINRRTCHKCWWKQSGFIGGGQWWRSSAEARLEDIPVHINILVPWRSTLCFRLWFLCELQQTSSGSL